jgi:hypothetical protein
MLDAAVGNAVGVANSAAAHVGGEAQAAPRPTGEVGVGLVDDHQAVLLAQHLRTPRPRFRVKGGRGRSCKISRMGVCREDIEEGQ